MNEPTIAVIIPNYNYAHFIKRCVESVFQQTVAPNEIIIIDDASTDDSLTYLEEIAATNSRIKLVKNSKNIGVLQNLRLGMQLTNCDYILPLASDDWLLPTLLQKSKALLQRYPEAAICSALSLEYLQQDKILRLYSSPSPRRQAGYLPPEIARKKLYKFDSWFLGNTVIYKKEIAVQLGGFREELKSFTDGFLFRLMALKHGACFIPEPLSVWRIHDHNYSKLNLQNEAVFLEIGACAEKLMGYEYGDVFTAKLIKRWKKRWLYMLNIGKIRRSNSKVKYFQMAIIIFKYRYFDIIEIGMRKISTTLKNVLKYKRQVFC
jgi:glycosyltransferase involved in cell wall biosynthesis